MQTFCIEISPKTSNILLKILKDPNSTTEDYIYFEKVNSASGYKIYVCITIWKGQIYAKQNFLV